MATDWFADLCLTYTTISVYQALDSVMRRLGYGRDRAQWGKMVRNLFHKQTDFVRV